MNSPVHPVIRRYANGEISAMQAASELGGAATVADVIVMLRQAGLKPPEPPPEQQNWREHVMFWGWTGRK